MKPGMRRRDFVGSAGSFAVRPALAAAEPSPPLVLWYRRPAAQWIEALPVGNGRLGAMVFGGIEQERLQLNEETVWEGFPRDVNNPAALKALPEVRRLLFEGRNEEATRLAGETMMAIPHRIKSYQTLGDLRLEAYYPMPVEEYRRELDLESGIAGVRYRAGNVLYTREIFASDPDNLLVMRIAADKPGRVTLRLTLTRPQEAVCRSDPNDPARLILRGRIDARDPKTGDPRGLRFEAQLAALAAGGKVSSKDGRLLVEGADALVLLLAAATDYRGNDPASICRKHLKAAAKPYEVLRGSPGGPPAAVRPRAPGTGRYAGGGGRAAHR